MPQNTKETGVIQRLRTDIQWIKWIIGAGLGIILTMLMYLHKDSNSRIVRMEERMTGMEKDLSEIKADIKLVLRKSG